MRVRLRQLAASSAGVFPAGSVVELPAEAALHLVKTGQAEMVDAAPEAEAAVAEPVAERAVSVKGRKRAG